MNSAGLIGDGYLPSRAAPEKSDRQLAKAIGVHHASVSRHRQELVEKNKLSQCDTSTGADGKEYPRQVERKAPEPELPIAPEPEPPVSPQNPGLLAPVRAGGRAVR